MDLEKVRKNQEKLNSNLSETRREKWEYKSEEQKGTLENLEMLYEAREKVIKLFDDYTTNVSKIKMKQNMGKDSKY